MNQEKIPTRLKPRLKVIDGEITTTSLDVAEKFGKQHKDVLKAVRNLECSEEFAKRNFAPAMETTTYKNSAGEWVTKETSRTGHYRMTRDGFAFLAMGFTGKEAGKWKEAYINAFSFMETRLVEVMRTMKQIEQSGVDKPLDFSDPNNLPAMNRALFLRLWEVFDHQAAPTGLIWWVLQKEAYKAPVVASYRDIAREVGGLARVSSVHRAAKWLASEGILILTANGRNVPSGILLVLDALNTRVAKSARAGQIDHLFSDKGLSALAANLKQIAAH